MGKRGKVPPPPPRPASAGGSGTSADGMAEPGLFVKRRRSGVAHTSALLLGIALCLGVLMLGLSTMPRLLCHFSWTVFTLFAVIVVGGRWVAADVATEVTFWLLTMVHGLVWLTAILVSLCGVLPGSLWRAFGQHGGDHLLIAQVGSIPMLFFPPAALTAYLWLEREFVAVTFHDLYTQLCSEPHRRLLCVAWHIASPVLPISLWSATLRIPIFCDLPEWPGAIAILGLCVLANAPILLYVEMRTVGFVGPALWFSDGVVVWHAPRMLYARTARAS